MEPIVDSSNTKKVPVVIWSKGSSSSIGEQKSLDGSVKSVKSINNKSPCNKTIYQKLNSEVSPLPKKTNDHVPEGVKFSDSCSLSSCDSFSSSSLSESSKEKVSKVPDGGWGWVVVFCSFIISMVADGISYSFGLLYIEFLNYFQESKSKTSWIGSLFMAVPLLSGPVMSALVDRYGCKYMTMLGGLISGAGFVIASFGNSIEWEFIFFGVVAGLGLGLCYVTAVVSIAYWFDKYRTLAIGLGSCGTGVGTFVYAPLTQFFINEYGWRGTILLLAGTFFNMCVCGALMRDPEWWSMEHSKSSLKSLKNTSSCGSMSAIEDNSLFKRDDLREQSIKEESSEDITKTPNTPNKIQSEQEETSIEDKLNMLGVQSVVNLPTFIRQNEKVSFFFFLLIINENSIFILKPHINNKLMRHKSINE